MTKNTFIKEVREFYFSNYLYLSSDFSIDDDLIYTEIDLINFENTKKYEYWK